MQEGQFEAGLAGFEEQGDEGGGGQKMEDKTKKQRTKNKISRLRMW